MNSNSAKSSKVKLRLLEIDGKVSFEFCALTWQKLHLFEMQKCKIFKRSAGREILNLKHSADSFFFSEHPFLYFLKLHSAKYKFTLHRDILMNFDELGIKGV